MRIVTVIAVLAGWAVAVAAGAAEQPAKDAQRVQPRQLSLENKPWKGDFEQMLERRMIRVLVPYSRTLFFVDKGRERGITADFVRHFERYLNQKYAKQLGKRPLTVYMITTTRDKLLSGLNEGYTGWAVRKDSPKLVAAIADFYQTVVVKQIGRGNVYADYHRRIKQLTNNIGSEEWKRFEQTIALFEKYGAKYGFDPLMLAAQGYQESQLNQHAKSHVGAIGVMQIMPATGSELRVGNIHEIEPNIHGGAKYMDQLMTRYFPDAKFSADVRPLFAFASYNAGPGNISRMRREAAKRGLNPDKWFNNVEIVVSERIGMETTGYVRNIYKYYTAYKLTLEAQERVRKAREQVVPAGK